jgi:hypothetical protein
MVLPIPLISTNLSPYSIIDHKDSFKYTSDDPSLVKSLSINAEIGDIIINYIDPPVDYIAKIDIYIKMAGKGLANKDFFDYFLINEGDTTKTPIKLSVALVPSIIESEVESLIENVSIIVDLRKDIVYNITTNINIGNIEIYVPFNVQINDMNVNTTHGDVILDLSRCIVGGNITGNGENGKISLISYNTIYSRNSVWTLSSKEGYINIKQEIPMGANVTGSITSTSDVPTYLIYNDSTSEVGAKFTLDNYTYPTVWDVRLEGFYDFGLELLGFNRYSSKSMDFPTTYNYILTLNLEGIIYPNLYSA